MARQPDDFDLDRMDVLLSRSVRGRRYGDNVNRRQIESGGSCLVDAGRGRARIDQSESAFRRRQRDPLGEKLLGDVLFDADGNLHDRASLLKRNEGWDLVPARILRGQLDVKDRHEAAPR
jgi:hypothetical protein